MSFSSFFRLLTLSLSKARRFDWTPNRVWMGIFAFWLFLLTGVTYDLGAGSPGLLQYTRLNGLLKERQSQLLDSDTEVEKIEIEAAALEKSRVIQEREIRKTMGYVGENELIFDFSLAQSAALRR